MQSDRKKVGMVSFVLKIVALLAFASTTTLAYSASKTVLVLGDSLSAEYGIARGSGWVPLLEQRLQGSNPDVKVINASISGETTSGGRSRLPTLLQQHRPGVVIIELGANDGLRGLALSATESNLRAMIAASQAIKAKVLLVGMQLPPNYGRDYATRFGRLFPKIANDTKIAFVPFLLEGIADKEQLFQADRLHPTAAAQPVILENVWPKLKPLLIK